jgi:hypothetical protein
MATNTIIKSAEPRGRFLEGIISGTPKPGTVMQIKAATERIGGRFTFVVYDRDADGDHPAGPFYVLLEDKLQGRTVDTAYADGERCFLYCPLPGDELNMLVTAAGTGTGDAIAIGDILMVDDGTGLLVATTGDPQTEAFMAAETLSDVVAAGTLTSVIFSGY